jgi:HEAT repeat protein
MKTSSIFLFLSILAWQFGTGGPLLAEEQPIADLIGAVKSSNESARLDAINHLAARGAQAADAVEPLTSLLNDNSAQVQAHAVYALGQIGEAAKPAVPALVALLKGPDATVRTQAVKAVMAINPGPDVTMPLCVKLLEDPDPNVRNRVLLAIAEAGPRAVPGLMVALKNDKAAYWACLILRDLGPAGKDAIPALVEKLQDPRPEIRREAILALGAMEKEAVSAAPEIAEHLADRNTAVAATYAIGRIGAISDRTEAQIRTNIKSDDKVLSTTSAWALTSAHPENKELRVQVTEHLIARLNDEDPYVCLASARALAALPPAPEITLPIWEKALEDADETSVAHALDALARLGKPAVPHLAAALKHQNLRLQIISVLNGLGPDAAAATESLAPLVADEDPRVAHSASLALASIGPGAASAVPALVKALQNPDIENAHSIAYALGEIGLDNRDAKAELLKLTTGLNQEVALISAWALTKIDTSPETVAKTLRVLVAGLSSPTAVSRRASAESLGELGVKASAAIPSLEEAAKDSDPNVRAAVAQALAQIRG